MGWRSKEELICQATCFRSPRYQLSLPVRLFEGGGPHWSLLGSSEHVQSEPWCLHMGKAGRGTLTTPPAAGWPLQKAHVALAQGCLLHASKYLQVQAPGDVNTLCQSASLHSPIHSESVDLSSILLPWPMPYGISGVSQAELRGAGKAHHAAACSPAFSVTSCLTPQVLLQECEAIRYNTTCWQT